MNVLLDNLDLFVTGFRNTLLLFVVSGFFALVLGQDAPASPVGQADRAPMQSLGGGTSV